MQEAEGEEARSVKLTPRELEIVQLLALGYSSEEIGQALEISPRTARNHIEHIRMKLDAKNRAHIVAIAMNLGFIGPGQDDEDMPQLQAG